MGRPGSAHDQVHSDNTPIEVSMPSSRAELVTLKIPRPLYDHLRTVIEGTGFRSVTEFCVYVLRDLVAAHDGRESGDMLTPEELSAIRRRLRALGYLD
jgi:hypothetical protein